MYSRAAYKKKEALWRKNCSASHKLWCNCGNWIQHVIPPTPSTGSEVEECLRSVVHSLGSEVEGKLTVGDTIRDPGTIGGEDIDDGALLEAAER